MTHRRGGTGLEAALVTSMTRAVKEPKDHEAGALFAVRRLGMRGLPEPGSRVKTIR